MPSEWLVSPKSLRRSHRTTAIRPPTPWSLPPWPPPKKPSRWLKRKNPSLPIIIGRSGTSPDDQAHWQPLRFFMFILSSRKAAVSTRRKRHDSIFTSLLKSRPVGPLPRRHRQTQPCRLASSNAPITVHACSFDALVARISSSAGMSMQPSRRRRHRVGPRPARRSFRAALGRRRRPRCAGVVSFSALLHLASAGLLKRGTAKARSGVPPGHGLDVEILPRWGDTTPGPTGTPAHWPSTRHTQPAGNQ